MNVNPARPKLRVYLSSTYQDLIEHRRKVDETLRRRGYEVVGMEGYAASDTRPLDRCVEDVRSSDIYVGIFAWRYGFIPPEQELSITELEYQAASDAGKERLIFLASKDALWLPEQIEFPAYKQFERFRGELQRDHTIRFFGSPDELANEVGTAITESERRRSAEFEEASRRQVETDRGRRRRRLVVNAPPIDVVRFINREDERRSLHDHLGNRSLRLIKVVGRAGIGKSALVSRELGELESRLSSASSDIDDQVLDGILYLSARTTGLSLERIQADAQQLLNEDAADDLGRAWASRDATIEQKVQTLLTALGDRRYVFVLDALDEVLDDELAVREAGLRAFLDTCLQRSGGPLLLVTSRADFHTPPRARSAIRSVTLDHGLNPEDSSALLRSLDPEFELGLRDAPAQQLEQLAAITLGNPRALELFVGILQQDPAASLNRLLENKESLEGMTVEELVAEGYRRLGKDARAVMQALAIFTAPVPAAAVVHLLQTWHPGIEVERWLHRLVRSFFVTASRQTGEFALQALDREHAYHEIPDQPQEAFGKKALELRAADYFASVRKPADEWHSLEDIQPQLLEIEHCYRAGTFDRALEVLQTIDEHHLALWGHYLRLIELRSSFLDKPVRADLCAANLAGLGASHQVFGRYDDAADCYRQAVEIAQRGDDREAEILYTGHLGRAYRNQGDMDRAVVCLNATLDHYQALEDPAGIAVWSDRLALAYWHLGRIGDAIQLAKRALIIAREVQDERTEAAALSNLGLMFQTSGQWEEARTHFAQSVVLAQRVRDRRGEAIALGREGTAARDDGDFDRALVLHGDALELAQALGERREQSFQLMGLGWTRAAIGDLERSTELLLAAKELDVSATSFIASLRLGLVLLRCRDKPAAAAAFTESAEHCHKRLGICDRLFAARYCLGTALVGQAVCSDGSGDATALAEKLAEAEDHYRRALTDCPGQGIISATLQDLNQLRTERGNELEIVYGLLRDAKETVPGN